MKEKNLGILVSCQAISKSYSSRPLFHEISFGIEEREQIGLIGPNGSGKSTLLKIIEGTVDPDQGSIVYRKQLRTAIVPQEENFPADDTIVDLITRSAMDASFAEHERSASIDSTITSMAFPDRNAKAGSLSGGWRKRLSLACALVKAPELLLLDEPTNHLDLEGVLWLEELLKSAKFSFVLISHDRAFLEGVSNRIVELNPTYPQGYISVKGNYSQFLEAKDMQLTAQESQQQALASKVRREIAWLQRGARARQTKAKGRIQDAEKLIDQLADVKQRNALSAPIEIGFDSSGRKTKELLSAKAISKSMGDRLLISDLSFVIAPGTKLGILGRNGSGKTTLLKMIAGQLQPDSGIFKRADGLKVVWFDQNREQLDQSKTLWESLSPSSDSVVYRGKSLHVSTWAKKFLFKSEQLNMQINYLSGGEQARILIANLMLKSADILILDEPTNDLDIPSLEVLEESLADFPGAVILVTHDRMMLDTVSKKFLVLSGSGESEFLANYQQCEAAIASFTTSQDKPQKQEKPQNKSDKQKSKNTSSNLSNVEARELVALPGRIERAEEVVQALQSDMEKPEIAADYARLQELMKQQQKAQKELDDMFARWEELESRK